VCLGNICRSPTAEGVMRTLVTEAGLDHHITVDSAGTGGWHVGKPPDPRTRAAAARRGVHLDHRAWQFTARDFDRFDMVLAMDGDNLEALEAMRGRRRGTLQLLRSYEPGAAAGAEVPDPYYGGDAGFDEVLEICERACRGLLDHLRREVAGAR